MIYIVSKDRTKLLVRAVKGAVETNLPIYVFVEPMEYRLYRNALREAKLLDDISLLKHPYDNMGVARARRTALLTAADNGEDIMLMVDDDLILPPNAYRLHDWLAKNPKRAGCAAYFDIYKHFQKIEPNTGVHRHNGSQGRRAFAIRTEVAIAVGAFSTRIPTLDDTDLVLRLFRGGYYPWYIHSDVVARSTAVRNGPGGINSVPGSIEDKEYVAYLELTEEFGPGLFSMTKAGRIRTSWVTVIKKFTDLDPKTLRKAKNV